MNKYISYANKLFKVLYSLRQPNGVFRASSSEHYNATWIRDNYWNSQPYLITNLEKYLQTCHTHIDFLHLWENGYDNKISWLIKNPDLKGREYCFIQPKVNFDGTEIDGLNWQFLQIDTLAYILLLLYQGHSKNLEVFRNESDKAIVQLLITALEGLDFCNVTFAHSWEEELGIFTSNLGLIMRALECAYEMGFNIDSEVLRKTRRKFYGQFPFERTGRDWDLTLLFLASIDDILKPVDTNNILNGIETNLLREYGVIRYKEDIYKPFNKITCDTEMEWCMGLAYLSLINFKQGNHSKGLHYLNSLIDRYPDGNIPEGVNCYGEPCDNTPLAWSVAITLLATQELLNKKGI